MKKMKNHLSGGLPVVVSVLVCLFCIWTLCLDRLPLTPSRLEKLSRQIESTRSDIELTLEDNRILMEELTPLWKMKKGSLSAKSIQNAALLFRERLETSAFKNGIRSRNMGNIRRQNLDQNMVLLEVTFSADGKTEQVVGFLQSLSNDTPFLYWKNLTIKPNSESLTISGTVCVLCIIPERRRPYMAHSSYDGKEKLSFLGWKNLSFQASQEKYPCSKEGLS